RAGLACEAADVCVYASMPPTADEGPDSQGPRPVSAADQAHCSQEHDERRQHARSCRELTDRINPKAADRSYCGEPQVHLPLERTSKRTADGVFGSHSCATKKSRRAEPGWVYKALIQA